VRILLQTFTGFFIVYLGVFNHNYPYGLFFIYVLFAIILYVYNLKGKLTKESFLGALKAPVGLKLKALIAIFGAAFMFFGIEIGHINLMIETLFFILKCVIVVEMICGFIVIISENE
jgi:hypothetical protein